MDDSMIRNEICGDAQPKLVLHFFEFRTDPFTYRS